jgi:hypothetical protein
LDYFTPRVKSRYDAVAAALTIALLAFYVFALVAHYQTSLPHLETKLVNSLFSSAIPAFITSKSNEKPPSLHWTPYHLDMTATFAQAVNLAGKRTLSKRPPTVEIGPFSQVGPRIRSRDPPPTLQG